MQSFWEQRSLLHTDVVIVGGGITGLSTAASIKEKFPNREVWVLERSILPFGASTRNAGFACYGSLTEVLSDIENMGEEAARQLLFQRWMGLKITRKRLGDTAIGYEENGGYELIPKEQRHALDAIDVVNDLVEDFLPDYIRRPEVSSNDLGIQAPGALVSMAGEGQVDTGKLMDRLEAHCIGLGVRIRTGCEVEEVHADEVVVSDRHRGSVHVKAEQVIVCTNAFAGKWLDGLSIQPGRGQVLITEPIKGLTFRGNLHLDEGFYYLRNVQDRLLFGGARNHFMEEETTHSLEVNESVQAHLEQRLRELFGTSFEFRVAQKWSGIMAFGIDKIPYIQRTSDGVIVAVKMSGMGIALAGYVGEEVADMIG